MRLSRRIWPRTYCASRRCELQQHYGAYSRHVRVHTVLEGLRTTTGRCGSSRARGLEDNCRGLRFDPSLSVWVDHRNVNPNMIADATSNPNGPAGSFCAPEFQQKRLEGFALATVNTFRISSTFSKLLGPLNTSSDSSLGASSRHPVTTTRIGPLNRRR